MKNWPAIVAAAVFGVFVGYVYSSLAQSLSPNHITVRVMDYSKCAGGSYSIELEAKTVSISKGQVSHEPTGMAAEADTIIQVLPKTSVNGQVRYTLRATYDQCPELLSSVRVVEPGWVLYESIRDGQVTHQVRAR